MTLPDTPVIDPELTERIDSLRTTKSVTLGTLLDRLEGYVAHAQERATFSGRDPVVDTMEAIVRDVVTTLEKAVRDRPWLSVSEAATTASRCEETIRSWARAGKVNARKLPSGQYEIDPHSLSRIN